MVRVCPSCGKVFTPKRCTQKYCCTKCRRYGTRHAFFPPEEEDAPVLRTFLCARCGAEVRVTSARDRRKRFCSVHCERMYWKHRRAERPQE